MKRFHILFITQSHSPYQRGPLGMPYNGDEDRWNDFPNDYMMPFHVTNLKPIIHTWRIPLRLSTSRFITLPPGLRFHIKDLLTIIQGLMSFIFTRLRGFNILSEDISYSHSYMYQVRDTSLPHKTHQYFTLAHIAYHSRTT